MRNIALALCLAFIALDTEAIELVPEDCLDRVCVSGYDSDHEEYLKRVLEAMGLAYSVRTKDGKNVVIWKSASKKQEEEVHARISHYFFVRDVCPGLPLPTPDQVADPSIWCEQ